MQNITQHIVLLIEIIRWVDFNCVDGANNIQNLIFTIIWSIVWIYTHKPSYTKRMGWWATINLTLIRWKLFFLSLFFRIHWVISVIWNFSHVKHQKQLDIHHIKSNWIRMFVFFCSPSQREPFVRINGVTIYSY